MVLSKCISLFMRFLSMFLLFRLSFPNFTSPKQSLCHDDERSALLEFKKSLIIDRSASYDQSAYPKVVSWTIQGNGDCCSWDGIKCNEDTGHVVILDLASSCLYGSIISNSSLFHLLHLQWLSLAHNHFSGTIPSSLGNLTHLSHLNLSDNGFSGELPISIGNLASLKELDMYWCDFSSQAPSSLGNLSQLSFLQLSFNNFFGGNSSSFSWIAKQTKLTYLGLSGLNLLGKLPFWLGNFTQLTELRMSANQLTGPIPYWLMNLNQLSTLTLMSNQLTGYIPPQIGNLTQLNFLDLSSNQLQGPIPSSIFELKNLESLVLYSNNLSGTIELELFLHELKSLDVLVLSLNNLSLLTENTINTGLKLKVVGLASCDLRSFLKFLQYQDQMVALDLSSNRITGRIPRWFLNVSVGKSAILNLSYNLFTGFDQNLSVLPWTQLNILDLSSNKMRGLLPVPPVSTILYLVSNNKLIAGDIRLQICHLKDLRALDLSYNNLSGVLPQCLGNFSEVLSVLGLQNNHFRGSIPETFMKETNLRMIDLSDNLLHGRIPRSLENCRKLEFLDLGNNQISDSFPTWLGSLPDLQVLILRSNRLHGVIREPEIDDGFHKLRITDLSKNEFTGNLPSKYFESWNAMKIDNASQLIYMRDDLLQKQALVHSLYVTYGSSILYDISMIPKFYYSLKMSNKGLHMQYPKISNILRGIILSRNRFNGEIPASIAKLKGLHILNLSNNNLQGHIPSCIANLTEVESLDFSKYNLSGEIPQQLTELTFLGFLDVSYNHLTGPIPQGKQFDTFENSSFVGNPELCGKPLSKVCEIFEAPQDKDEGSSGSPLGFGWKPVLIGYGSGLILESFLLPLPQESMIDL